MVPSPNHRLGHSVYPFKVSAYLFSPESYKEYVCNPCIVVISGVIAASKNDTNDTATNTGVDNNQNGNQDGGGKYQTYRFYSA